MMFSKTVAVAIIISVAQGFPVQASNCTVELSSQEQSELTSLVTSLQQYNEQHSVSKRDLVLLEARSNIPILDRILVLLKDSGLANVVIKNVLLHPTLLDLSSNAFIFVLRLNLINYADVFTALEKSGLVNQLLLATLDDPSVLPGILRLTSDLLKKNAIDIALNGAHVQKRDVSPQEFDFSEKRDVVLAETELSKRESQLLDELLVSVKDSGLVVSVVENLLTDPELAAPSAQFLINILQSGAIPFGEIVHTLIQNGTLFKIVGDILTDKQILSKFAEVIVDRVSKGIIPKDLLNDVLNGNNAASGTSTVSAATETSS